MAALLGRYFRALPTEVNRMKYPILRPVAELYRPASTLRMRPRSRGNYVQECNHVYAEAHGLGLVMDIFRPEGTANGRGVVDVISGGWCSDRGHLNEHIGLGVFDVLCDRGYTVFALSPGSVGKFTGLEMVRHVQTGIRHVKALAEAFCIDPDRMGLIGASAGGHLAALAALRPRKGQPESRDPFRRKSSDVSAVGLFFPPTDFLDYGGALFDFMAEAGVHYEHLLFDGGLAGRGEDEVQGRMAALSPARQVSGAPPSFLLVHGSIDPVVPLSQSEKLAQALRAVGGAVELIVKDGGKHAWPEIQTEIEKLADWLDRRLEAGG